MTVRLCILWVHITQYIVGLLVCYNKYFHVIINRACRILITRVLQKVCKLSYLPKTLLLLLLLWQEIQHTCSWSLAWDSFCIMAISTSSSIASNLLATFCFLCSNKRGGVSHYQFSEAYQLPHYKEIIILLLFTYSYVQKMYMY